MDLLRQITEEKPYPIKAVFACGMNAKMFPQHPQVLRGPQVPGLLCGCDLFMTDTAKYADIVLPACTSFERGEFKAYPGGYAQFTNPVIKPLYESKNDVQILRAGRRHGSGRRPAPTGLRSGHRLHAAGPGRHH